MKYYLAIDGGGTKLNAILFDENIDRIAQATAGGTNGNFATAEVIRGNMEACIGKIFDGRTIGEIECVYGVVIGDFDLLFEVIERHAHIKRKVNIGESMLCANSSGVFDNGVIALGGTGSDVFLIENGKLSHVFGGFGAFIGDDGGGYYLGRLALRAAIAEIENRGAHTLLTEMITEALGGGDLRERIFDIYTRGAVVREIAQLTRVVGKAASCGDEIAKQCLIENGKALAVQTNAMIEKYRLPNTYPVRVVGGCFKSHPLMWRSFYDEVHRAHPDFDISPALFEPVAGCIAHYLHEQKGELSDDDIARIFDKYPEFKYII